ncbi:type I-E CRISPR-associated protein Cse2/CasB [Streptomyces misionensis]|uniref:type I-E CRISPR-associated protein Cse2/CasB n=1 Tax=Streptomyces misionensis TaxID=67331 RepID=UPI0036FE5ABA
MTDSVAAVAPPTKYDRFVAEVHRLCQDNRTRAELRRGLGLPVERCNYMHRYLVPWLRDHDDQGYGDVRRAYYGVASLIAARPRSARHGEPETAAGSVWHQRPNLGTSLGHAVTKDVLKPNTAESALHLMSRQSSDAVHRGLPALIAQLTGGGTTVDWAVLLKDMSWWAQDRDRIATRWLDSYFRTATGDDTNPGTDADTDLPEENER